jgi:hypothetical protein
MAPAIPAFSGVHPRLTLPRRRLLTLRLGSLGWPANSVTLENVTGRTYAENRPYLLPESLGELAGPVAGVVQLPPRLDWSERTRFHLDDPAERNVMYERVIREATRIDDLRSYLNGAVLCQIWLQLFLPARVRQSWEERFPALKLAA